MRISYPVLLVVIVLCSAPLDADGLDLKRILEPQSGAEPALNLEAHTLPGERMYSEFDYADQAVAELQADLRYNRKITIQAGEPLLGVLTRKGDPVYCSRHQRSGGHGGGFVCLRDADGDEKFDAFSIQGTSALIAKNLVLKEPAAAEFKSVALPGGDLPGYSGKFFRNEILYQGASKGTLRLLYREFLNDMARPAFTQELSFDMEEEGATIAIVKGARLEILEAGNEGVRFKVTQGFSGQ